MNHNYIGTEHLLLALLRRPEASRTRRTASRTPFSKNSG